MKKGFYIGLLFCICSCIPNPLHDGAFLGGQIINPSSEKVSLYKNNKLLDTLVLDDKNRFSRSYDSFNTGFINLNIFLKVKI